MPAKRIGTIICLISTRLESVNLIIRRIMVQALLFRETVRTTETPGTPGSKIRAKAKLNAIRLDTGMIKVIKPFDHINP